MMELLLTLYPMYKNSAQTIVEHWEMKDVRPFLQTIDSNKHPVQN